MEKRSVGRPKGHKLSEETKAKIRRGVLESVNSGGNPVPKANHPDVTLSTREAVFERDKAQCQGCHAQYFTEKNGKKKINSSEGIQVFTWDREAEANDLENNALLCSWCINNAKTIGAKSVDGLISM